jgi:hypothetical protein
MKSKTAIAMVIVALVALAALLWRALSGISSGIRG